MRRRSFVTIGDDNHWSSPEASLSMAPTCLLYSLYFLLFVTITAGNAPGYQAKYPHLFRPIRFQGDHLTQSHANSLESLASSIPFSPKGIKYHGGSVLDSGINLYVVWYGNWTTIQKGDIRSFIKSMTTDPDASSTVGGWWKINSLYFNSLGQYLAPAITIVTEIFDNYSYGSGINFVDIANLMRGNIASGNLPDDPEKGVYLVLSSSDVTYLGFCVSLCADRGAFYFDSAPAVHYPIGWVGDPSFQCPDSCSPNKRPSGSLTIDATINFLAQLLSVIKTNPFFNGWYDDSNSYNYSNAEKCSWNFGTPLGDGSYNVKSSNGAKYYIQLNWNPRTGACAIDDLSPPPPPKQLLPPPSPKKQSPPPKKQSPPPKKNLSPPPPPSSACSAVYPNYKLELNRVRLAHTYKTSYNATEASCIAVCNLGGKTCPGFSFFESTCYFQSTFGGDSMSRTGGKVWVKCVI